MRFENIDKVGICFAVVIAFVYMLNAPNGLTWDLNGADGGELAAGVIQRGVVHPPGYPTYVLIAQFARLLPVASFAYRLNLFSCLCGGTAAALLYCAIRRSVMNAGKSGWQMMWAALVSAGFFAASDIVWNQAIITEVYALAGLFCCAIVFNVVRVTQHTTERKLRNIILTTTALIGFGLGSHYLTGFAGLFAAIYLFVLCGPSLLKPNNVLYAVLGVCFGLLVFLYLPLFAPNSPIVNWGNVDSIDRFGWMIRASAYSDRLNLAVGQTRFREIGNLLIQNLTLPGLAFASIGFANWLVERRWHLWIPSLIMITLNLVVMASYFSADTQPYLYPALIILCMCAAQGMVVVATTLKQSGFHAYIAPVLCTVCLLYSVAQTYPKISIATIDADRYGQNVLGALNEQTVIVTDREAQTFAVWYAVAATKTAHIPVSARLLTFDWYVETLQSHYPQLTIADDTRSLSDFLETVSADIPIVYTYQPPELDQAAIVEISPELFAVDSNR